MRSRFRRERPSTVRLPMPSLWAGSPAALHLMCGSIPLTSMERTCRFRLKRNLSRQKVRASAPPFSLAAEPHSEELLARSPAAVKVLRSEWRLAVALEAVGLHLPATKISVYPRTPRGLSNSCSPLRSVRRDSLYLFAFASEALTPR